MFCSASLVNSVLPPQCHPHFLSFLLYHFVLFCKDLAFDFRQGNGLTKPGQKSTKIKEDVPAAATVEAMEGGAVAGTKGGAEHEVGDGRWRSGRHGGDDRGLPSRRHSGGDGHSGSCTSD